MGGAYPGQSHLPLTSGTENPHEKVIVPARAQATDLNADLGALHLLEQVERRMTEDGEVLGCIAGAHAAVVLTKGDIEDPVKLVFDSPVGANGLEGLGGGETEAGADHVALLGRSLAPDGPVDFDEREATESLPLIGLRNTIERGGGPAAPHLDATMSLLARFGVIHRRQNGRVRAGRGERGDEVLAKRGLVVLDRQAVVGAFVDDSGRDVLLAAHGIDRHDAALEIWQSEKLGNRC